MEKNDTKVTYQLSQKGGGKALITGEAHGEKDILEKTLNEGETLEIKEVDRGCITDLKNMGEIYEKSLKRKPQATEE